MQNHAKTDLNEFLEAEHAQSTLNVVDKDEKGRGLQSADSGVGGDLRVSNAYED